MADSTPTPSASLPRGLRDRDAASLLARRTAVRAIEEVYRLHGFAPLETPAIETAEGIGAFLPDEAGGGGVFALRDSDGSALALRYDMTAPLARHVASRRGELLLPFRRYAIGPVWRDEKPGPGRFREFWQCDVDTVGAPVGAADAELCATLAAVFEALGLPGDGWEIRLSSRRLLDGVLESAGLGDDDDGTRQAVLRAVDKMDRLGAEGVRALLGEGRQDESGDYTKGAGLAEEQIERVMGFVASGGESSADTLRGLAAEIGGTAAGKEGIDDLERILDLLESFPCGAGVARVDPSIVRGLGYYTGPVIEAVLTIVTRDKRGRETRFGSVAGGGRYDRLVRRFGGDDIPATGVSIGVDRLVAALESLQENAAPQGPVVVLDMGDASAAQRAAAELRAAGIAAEAYTGRGGMRKQMRYADRRDSPAAVIEGDAERAEGVVQVKDLVLGRKLAAGIESHEDWMEHPAQATVPRERMAETVRGIIAGAGTNAEPDKP